MVQRSKGRSATAAIAYRAGVEITDERTGLHFNYTRKKGVSFSEIVLPEGASADYRDRSKLWNSVEQAETRKNSAVAREFELALPYDLPRQVREQLASEITHFIVGRFGVPADANCHDPHPRKNVGDNHSSQNFHVHILTGTRKLTAEGFTEKVRELDNAGTGSLIIEELREHWAGMVNTAYATYGIAKFVDHRSYERRGIERAPQVHVGVNQNGYRANENAAIIASNAHLERIEHEVASIRKQIHRVLVEHTPLGETVPMFALEKVHENSTFSSHTGSELVSQAPDARQLAFSFADLFSIAGPDIKAPVSPTLSKDAIETARRQRYVELEQLKKKAAIYGRAVVEHREHRSDAASFQRELDNLERPSIMHRLIGSRRWVAYEQKRSELEARVIASTLKADKLYAIAMDYREHQLEWDKSGYAEHASVGRELGYKRSKSDDPLSKDFASAPKIATSPRAAEPAISTSRSFGP